MRALIFKGVDMGRVPVRYHSTKIASAFFGFYSLKFVNTLLSLVGIRSRSFYRACLSSTLAVDPGGHHKIYKILVIITERDRYDRYLSYFKKYPYKERIAEHERLVEALEKRKKYYLNDLPYLREFYWEQYNIQKLFIRDAQNYLEQHDTSHERKSVNKFRILQKSELIDRLATKSIDGKPFFKFKDDVFVFIGEIKYFPTLMLMIRILTKEESHFLIERDEMMRLFIEYKVQSQTPEHYSERPKKQVDGHIVEGLLELLRYRLSAEETSWIQESISTIKQKLSA